MEIEPGRRCARRSCRRRLRASRMEDNERFEARGGDRRNDGIASSGKAEEEQEADEEETQTRKREEGKGIEARKVRCGRMYRMVVPIENVSERRRTWSMALLLFVRATLGFSCSTLSTLTRLEASSPRNTRHLPEKGKEIERETRIFSQNQTPSSLLDMLLVVYSLYMDRFIAH